MSACDVHDRGDLADACGWWAYWGGHWCEVRRTEMRRPGICPWVGPHCFIWSYDETPERCHG